MDFTIEQRIRLGAATVADFETLGVEGVSRAKSDSEHTFYRGCEHVALKAKTEVGERKVLRLIASTRHKDYYGDRISVRGETAGAGDARRKGRGWQLDGYKRNGSVYLWSHNMGETKVPIGQALKTWTGKVGQALEGVKGADEMMRAAGIDSNELALMQDVEFLSADQGLGSHGEFSETIYLLMSGEGTRSGKPIMGNSVGFVPVRAYWPQTKEEREALDLGVWGVLYLEQALLENSATPTPANPFASVLGGKKGAPKKSFEARVLEELAFIEETGKLPAAIVRNFRDNAVLGPDDAARKLKERLGSRVFISHDLDLEDAPEGFDQVAYAAPEKSLEEEVGSAIEKVLGEEQPEVQPEDGAGSGSEEPAGLKLQVRHVRSDGEDGEVLVELAIDSAARSVLQRAYDGADTAMAALGALLDAVDEKNTDPDLESSTGVEVATIGEVSERVASLEGAIARLSDQLAGVKTTTRTAVPDEGGDGPDARQPDELTEDTAKAIADAVGI